MIVCIFVCPSEVWVSEVAFLKFICSMNQTSVESNESFAAITTGSSSKATAFRKKQALSTPSIQLAFQSSKLKSTGIYKVNVDCCYLH